MRNISDDILFVVLDNYIYNFIYFGNLSGGFIFRKKRPLDALFDSRNRLFTYLNLCLFCLQVAEFGYAGSMFITYYDDVARDIIDMKGAYGSLPTSIEAGEAYTYNKQLTLPKVEDWKKCSLTAFVANRLTGEIINANRVRLDPENIPDSVEGVSSDLREIKAMVENGNLSVEGNYSEARVYALDGTAVATLLQGDRVALGSGVYVVKAACAGSKDKVLKVMVK